MVAKLADKNFAGGLRIHEAFKGGSRGRHKCEQAFRLGLEKKIHHRGQREPQR
jgi:hypothetical protein